jgi:hypothetical protein
MVALVLIPVLATFTGVERPGAAFRLVAAGWFWAGFGDCRRFGAGPSGHAFGAQPGDGRSL